MLRCCMHVPKRSLRIENRKIEYGLSGHMCTICPLISILLKIDFYYFLIVFMCLCPYVCMSIWVRCPWKSETLSLCGAGATGTVKHLAYMLGNERKPPESVPQPHLQSYSKSLHRIWLCTSTDVLKTCGHTIFWNGAEDPKWFS